AQIKLIMDVGLASISFFTALISIFLAAGSICRQIEEKTIYTVLTKPVSRLSFVLGNFLGMIWVILVTLALTGLTLFMLLYLKGHIMGETAWVALFFIFLEAALITSIALMFSSLSSSSATSTIFTFLIYLVGHFNPQLRFLGERWKETIGRWAIKIAGWILPNLEGFNIRSKVVQGIPISANRIAISLAYAAIYICAMLILSYLILERREL
ncbi:MAG: ABC transporter permease, partial [bacterium]